MIGWIALGVVVLALLLLVLAVLPVLAGLRRLNRALHGLRRRTVEAQALQPAAEALAHRAESVREALQTIADRVAVLQAKNHDDTDAHRQHFTT